MNYKKLEEDLLFFHKIYDEIPIPKIGNTIYDYINYIIHLFLATDEGQEYLKLVLIKSTSQRLNVRICSFLIFLEREYCINYLEEIIENSKDEYLIGNTKYLLDNYNRKEFKDSQDKILQTSVVKCNNKYPF